MVKACILAFVSGVFFFFLILESAWWLIPGVLTWIAIFVWQDRRESTRGTKVRATREVLGNQARGADPDPNKKN